MPTLGALRFPTFNPAMATITAITRSFPAIVQTSFAHTFIPGQFVRFSIPESYGMPQINNMTGVIVFTTNTLPTFFQVGIDTTGFDAFVVPVNPQQSAQAVPAGATSRTVSLNNVQTNTPYPPYGANVNILDNTEYPPYPNPSPQP